MQNDELMHYGVLGMKWGVRRYQKPDGSLTLYGKRRFNSVNKDKEKAKKVTRIAKTLLESNSQQQKDSAIDAKELGDFEEAKRYVKSYKKYDKMLSDINNGTIKAGRDFITTKSKHFGSVEERIIFKKSDSEIRKNRSKTKDNKTYNKTGIEVKRDKYDRVIGLSAKNASKKQIRKINKMQRSISKKGDY